MRSWGSLPAGKPQLTEWRSCAVDAPAHGRTKTREGIADGLAAVTLGMVEQDKQPGGGDEPEDRTNWPTAAD